MRRIIERIDYDSIVCSPSGIEPEAIPHAPPVRLKCPDCGDEIERAELMRVDAAVRCTVCSAVSEFRVWHETWCLSRRPLLRRAFARRPV
jgi:predicted RNA-binding Zn-ribbon protein involved in translation (DUF1610 family)